jgi:colicin import membrane protein
VILHVAVLLFVILSFEYTSRMPVLENVNNNSKVISAIAMNAPDQPTESAPLPPPPKPAPKVEQKPVIAKQLPPVVPKQLIDDVLKQSQAMLQKENAIALKAQRKKQLAKQKELLAKQLLDDLKKQTAKKDTKQKQQKALEAAMEKELKEQAAKALQQQLQNEARVAGAKAQGEVNKYKALILQAISRRWLVPTGVNKSLSSELMIRLAPGGAVLDVQVTRSSGDVALDRSARDAVFKASPLPVPTEADGFDQFRQFVLKVKPENIVVNEIGTG